jgi:AcrR family transcriptional regulator
MKRKNDTKTELLSAFDKSEKQTIGDVCRIVGVTPSTFYFHFYKNADFRRQVVEKKMNFLAAKLAAEPINRGENV